MRGFGALGRLESLGAPDGALWSSTELNLVLGVVSCLSRRRYLHQISFFRKFRA